MDRIARTFANLLGGGEEGACDLRHPPGDPDYETSLEILKGLPAAGADIIELGMPFSDPMADGPAIQRSSQRALRGGQTMRKTLQMVRSFREGDKDTPIILMGYYNPIYVFPVNTFLAEAADAGVDGLIVVDVPAEANNKLSCPRFKAGLSFIRLTAPTTTEHRLETVLANTSSFVSPSPLPELPGRARPIRPLLRGASRASRPARRFRS